MLRNSMLESKSVLWPHLSSARDETERRSKTIGIIYLYLKYVPDRNKLARDETADQ
jgi:hypothetical protein